MINRTLNIIKYFFICAIILLLLLFAVACDGNDTLESSDIYDTSSDITEITSSDITSMLDTDETSVLETQTTDLTTNAPPASSENNGSHTHSYGDWVTVIQPTCVQKGSMERECLCGDVQSLPIDYSPHNIIIDDAVPPTCELGGLSEGSHCLDCLTIIIDQEELEALGHTEVVDIAVDPTCEKSGLTEGSHCITCFKVIVVQKVIPSTGHTPGDWVVSLPPTVSINGMQYQLCKGCNMPVKEEVILATGSLGLSYKQLFPNVAICTVNGMGTCKDTELHIGTLVEGNRVSDISNDAFSNESSIISLNIHGPIEVFGSRAFKDCANLTDVVLPERIDIMGSEVFSGCTSLNTVTMPKKLEILSVKAFFGCSSLKSAILPDNLSVIQSSCFEGCSSLEEITMPNTVTSISEYAFKDCISLKKINFNGTKAEWNSVNKSNDWKMNVSSVLIHCIDGNIVE